MGFAVGEAKRAAPIEKGKGAWQINIIRISLYWIFLGGKDHEDNKRQQNGQIWMFL